MNRPPNIPPAMPFGPDMGPEAWSGQGFRPNPERPAPLDRSIGGVMGQEMGMRLRQAIKSNEVTKPMMDRWAKEPWLAYPFLSKTVQTNDPMMAALSRWYLAASVGRNPEQQRQLAAKWAQTEPDAANALRGLVGSVQGGLNTALDTQLATRAELSKMRLPQDANALEGFGSKFADYMRDWREHPVTAAGVVLGVFMIYKTIRNKNIGGLIGMGALGIALYSFLRDQYGIEPLESLVAKPLDKWGLPTAANIVRKTRDTIKRPFSPEDETGSAFSYLGDKLGINGDDEKRMLGAVWDMKPGDFLAAHQAVLNQKLAPPSQRVTLPPAVRQILRQMGADQTFARRWANTPENERADLFLRVSNKVLASMPGGMRMGAKHISDRFVTGAFFQESFARRGGRMAATQTTSPVEAQISGHMQYAVQHADMRMGDVLLATVMNPEDWQNIKGYKHGYSAMQMVNGLQDAGGRVFDWSAKVAGQGWEILSKDVPDVWNYNIWPMLQRNGFNRETAIGIKQQAEIFYEQAKNSVVGFKDFVVGTEAFRITRDGTLYIWNKGVLQWEKLGNWLQVDVRNAAVRGANEARLGRTELSVGKDTFTNWKLDSWSKETVLPDGRSSFPALDRTVWNSILQSGILQDAPEFSGDRIILSVRDANSLRLILPPPVGTPAPIPPAGAVGPGSRPNIAPLGGGPGNIGPIFPAGPSGPTGPVLPKGPAAGPRTGPPPTGPIFP